MRNINEEVYKIYYNLLQKKDNNLNLIMELILIMVKIG